MAWELPSWLWKIEGADRGEAMFGGGAAVWVDGREILHRDADGRFDLRLTRQAIRELRPRLGADPRVRLRASTSSDWIDLEVPTVDDETLLRELVRRAVAEHLPLPGEGRKAPPEGEALARRRRLH